MDQHHHGVVRPLQTSIRACVGMYLVRAGDDPWESLWALPLAMNDGIEDGWMVGTKIDEAVAHASLVPASAISKGCGERISISRPKWPRRKRKLRCRVPATVPCVDCHHHSNEMHT